MKAKALGIILFQIVLIALCSVSITYSQENHPANEGDFPVLALAFSPDDSLLAAARSNGKISIWETKNFKLLDTISVANWKLRLQGREQFGQIGFFSTGTLVAVLEEYSNAYYHDPSEDSQTKIISVPDGKLIKRLELGGEDNNTYWTQTAYSDGMLSFLGLNYNSGSIPSPKIMRIKNNIVQGRHLKFSNQNMAPAMSSNGKYLVSIAKIEDSPAVITFFRHDLATLQVSTYAFTYELPKNTDTVVLPGGTAITDDGKLAAIGVRYWFDCPEDAPCPEQLRPHGKVYLYDLYKDTVLHVLNEEVPINELLFIGENKGLISLTCMSFHCEDMRFGTMKIWDVSSGKVSLVLHQELTYNEPTIVSHNGGVLVNVGEFDIEIWKIDGTDASLVKRLK